MKILTLNCQKEHGRGVAQFIDLTLESGEYDFLLLQEVTDFVAKKINPALFSYNILQAMHDLGDVGHLYILYRKSIFLLDSKFSPFTDLGWRYKGQPGLGLLLAKFSIEESHLVIGNLHVTAGPWFRLREKGLKFVKRKILEYNQEKHPVIFGGDFNSALPWENRRIEKIFSLEFGNCTSSSGTTCDSRHTEPVLFGRISCWLARVGIYFLLKIDHIYADQKTLGSKTIHARVLADRVSDHSPLEVWIQG